MAIVLFDNSLRKNFFPLAFSNALAALRCGIFTPLERWKLLQGQDVCVCTEPYLQPLYTGPAGLLNIWVDATLVLSDELLTRILTLQTNEALYDNIGLIAGCTANTLNAFNVQTVQQHFAVCKEMKGVERIQSAWHMMHYNDALLRYDYRLVLTKKQSHTLSSTNNLINGGNIFIDEDVQADYCTINASAGPVYIGKHAQLMEGSVIKGPVAICAYATVKAGTRIYAATTVGPYCITGGEIKNAIFQACSNKGHDGYVGDAVIGSWCNLGAGTTNSNVKNNGSIVNVWNYTQEAYSGFAPKAGMIMGDHTKTAINSAINTGTTIGVCCNVFGDGCLSKKLLNNFSWGINGHNSYRFDKAVIDIANWKKMKGQEITAAEIQVLKHIFDHF